MNFHRFNLILSMTILISALSLEAVPLTAFQMTPEARQERAGSILAERLQERGAVLSPDRGLPVRFATDSGMAPESYTLQVTPAEIVITAADKGGSLYGAYALLEAAGNGLEVPEMKISDAPANAWRGVYLNLRAIDASKPETLDNLKRLFYALSRQRINKLVIEFADLIQYPHVQFPVTAARALTVEQVKELIAEAEALNQEIIPYLQALSHATWILSDPANRRFLEDPGCSNWYMTWCPRDPEMRAWFQQVIDDTVELFAPRYIHLALDEIPFCSWQMCERCKNTVSEELYGDTVIDYHGMLAKHGVRLMLWHDLFMPLPNPYDPDSKVPAVRILDRLPQDIVMNVWTYEADKAAIQQSIDHFTRYGFEVLGAGFNRPDMVQGMAQAYAASPKGLGFLNTYWFYAGDWSKFATTAVLTAMTRYTGLYGWNPDAPAWNEYAGNPVGDVTRHFYEPGDLSIHLVPSPLPLPGNWRWDGRAADWIDGIPESLAAYGPDRCAWKLNPERLLWTVRGPEKSGTAQSDATVAVNRKMAALEFIHASSAPPNRAELSHMERQVRDPRQGAYRVRYSDGEEVVIPLHYRRNITDWNAPWPGLAAESFYQKTNADGICLTFTAWRWLNPRPEVPIASIQLEAEAATTIYCADIYAWEVIPQPLLDDTMRYASPETFLQSWTLNCSATTAQLTTSPDGGVNVSTPGTGNTPGRIILDRLNQFPDGAPAGVNVEVQLEYTGTRADIAIYLADAEWKNFRSFYWPILPGKNDIIAGWNNFRAEQGDLKPEDIRHLRVAFNLLRDTPPVELLLRSVRCAPQNQPPPPRRGGWQQQY